MGEDRDQARAALLALADLALAATQRTESLAVPLGWFRWLDDGLQLMGTAVQPTTLPGVVGQAATRTRLRNQFDPTFGSQPFRLDPPRSPTRTVCSGDGACSTRSSPGAW